MSRAFYMGVVMLLPDDTRQAFREAARHIRLTYAHQNKAPACVDFTGSEPRVRPKPEHPEELFTWAKDYTVPIDSVRSRNAGYASMLYKQRKNKKNDRKKTA